MPVSLNPYMSPETSKAPPRRALSVSTAASAAPFRPAEESVTPSRFAASREPFSISPAASAAPSRSTVGIESASSSAAVARGQSGAGEGAAERSSAAVSAGAKRAPREEAAAASQLSTIGRSGGDLSGVYSERGVPLRSGKHLLGEVQVEYGQHAHGSRRARLN